MANIPNLPTGQGILVRGKATEGDVFAYGPGSTSIIVQDGIASLLNDASTVLAFTKRDGSYAVTAGALDPATVPYVNRFIADWGSVKRDWRTKTYKVTSNMSAALMSEVESPETVAVPVMAPSKAPAIVAEVEAQAEVESDPTEVAAPIPVAPTVAVTGSIIPAPQPKVKVKHRTIAGQDVVTMGKVTVPQHAYDTLVDAWEDRQAGRIASVLVTGPSGTAKTLMVKAFAASLGVPFIKVDGGAIRTADDWFGALKQDTASRIFAFSYSPFGTALKQGVQCVVLLDEANRAETPQALNAALGLLDETGTCYVPDAKETLEMHDGMLVVITANKGAEYVGTVPFDAAVVQRFGSGIALDYPVAAVEVEVLHEVTGIDKETAKVLVTMAGHQRPLRTDLTQFPSGTGISTRMLVDISRRIVNHGRTARVAIDANFAAQFDVEDRDALVTIVDIYFPRESNDTLSVDIDAINEG